MVYARILDSKPSLEEVVKSIEEKCSAQGYGSLVVYVGYVKGVVDGHKVYELQYEAYMPYAERVLRMIAEEYARMEGVCDVAIIHRVGALKPGEEALYIVVSAEPRSKAFRVAEEILERVKREPPIFKLERRSDGDYWVLGDGRRIPRG